MSSELSEHKGRVAATYNLASAGYDQEAVRFFPLCAHRLVELIDLHPGQRVLDVATGTGAAAIAAARRVGPSGHVVGVDIATDMLKQAHKKIEAAHLTNIELLEGDAEHLSFAEQSFNAVICAFGIFFLPEMLAGPREWKRVVREAGVVAISAFGETTFQPFSDLFEARIRTYGVSFPVPRHPFSWQRLTSLEQCRRLLQDAGLEQIEGRSEQLGYYLRAAEEWWQIVWNSGFRGPVSQLSPEQLEHFKREHLAEVGQLVTEQGIWLDITAFFAWGYKPPVHLSEEEAAQTPAD
jgi:ubiquinone/menaquinone biosynthesis C-methylase UbiE